MLLFFVVVLWIELTCIEVVLNAFQKDGMMLNF